MRGWHTKAWGVLALAMCGCGLKSAVPFVQQQSVATINGEAIGQERFEQTLERNLRRFGSEAKSLPPPLHARMQQSVLRQMVEQTLVAQKAQELGVQIADKELDDTLNAHRARFRSEESFQDYLARSNNTTESLREDLRQSLLTDRVVEQLGKDVSISEADIAAHYEDNKERFALPERMQLHRLWLPFGANASPAKKESVRAQAQRLRARAKREPFEALCRRYSQAPEAARQGDLHLVLPGRFVELDRQIAAGLKVGEISEPIVDHEGYALFRLDALHAKSVRPIAEVAPQIRHALDIRRRNERRASVLRELQANASVRVHIALETGDNTAGPYDATSGVPGGPTLSNATP